MADIKDHVSVLRNNQDLLPGGEGEDFWPPHGWTHEDGNYDEISIEGLSGVTGDMQDAQWLRGIEIEDSIPLDGEVLVYNDFTGEWEFQPVSGLGVHWSRNVINEYLYPTNVDDTIQIGDGSESQPGLSFASALNTGLRYESSDDSIRTVLSGVDKFGFSDSSVIRRIESLDVDNSHYIWELLHRRYTAGTAPRFYIQSVADQADAEIYVTSNSYIGSGITTLQALGPSAQTKLLAYASTGSGDIDIEASSDSLTTVDIRSQALSGTLATIGLTAWAFGGAGDSEIDISADSTVNSAIKFLPGDTTEFYGNYNHLFDVYYSAGSIIDSQQEYFVVQNQRLSAGQSSTFWIDVDANLNGNIFIENTAIDGTAYSLFKSKSTDGVANIVISSESVNNLASLDLICESSAGDSQISMDHEIYFDDSYRSGSTWTDANGIPLAESSAEWTAARALLGSDGSILALISAAAGAPVGGFTQYSIPFANSSGILTENNTDLYYADISSMFRTRSASASATTNNIRALNTSSGNAIVDIYSDVSGAGTAQILIRTVGGSSSTINIQNGDITETAPTIRLNGTTSLTFDDGSRSGSTWSSSGIRLASSAAQWSNLELVIGSEGSLFGAIIAATNELVAEGEGTSANSTTSSSYQQRIRVTTPSLISGSGYLILYSCELQAVADNEVQARVQLNDTTTIAEMYYDNDPYATRGTSQSGIYYSNTLSGVYNIDLDWRNAYGGGLVYCGRARIVVLRVNI